MERKPYCKQLISWWICPETYNDLTRVLFPALFKKSDGILIEKNYDEQNLVNSEGKNIEKLNEDESTNILADSGLVIKNCSIIKEAIHKLQQFLIASHKRGCSNQQCLYDENVFRLKIDFQPIIKKVKDGGVIPTKRKRKTKNEKFNNLTG